MATSKRRKLVTHAYDPGTSLASASRILCEMAEGSGASAKQLARELHDRTDIWTPVGKVIQPVSLQLADNETYRCACINPCALLYHLCCTLDSFARFFWSLMRSGIASLILYTDECTTGNQLRPDCKTKLQCVYWTFSFFPHWYRARSTGWFSFTYIPYEVQERVVGGMAAVGKVILKAFFSDTFNFSTGFWLVNRAIAQRTFFQCRLLCFIQDEKAHKEITAVKGASGTKCCLKCKNVTRLVDVRDDPYFQDFASALPASFDLHTQESFEAMVQKLSDSAGNITRRQFKVLQQSLGLNYEPRGILWDATLRPHFSPVKHCYEDWMHTLLASGGIGQYELNAFVHAAAGAGVDPSELDIFHRKIIWPTRLRPMPKDFFEKRIVGNCDGHIKCFASEAIQAIQALSLFVQLVLQPAGSLHEESRSMLLLCAIVAFFCMSDDTLNYMDQLTDAVQEHHLAYIAAYGKKSVKPKMHYLYHTVSSMLACRVNLSCFAPERKHRECKIVARNCKGLSIETHVLRKMMLHFTVRLQHKDAFLSDFLLNPKPAPQLRAILLPLVDDLGLNIQEAKQLRTHLGIVGVGDFVFARAPAGQEAGIIAGCAGGARLGTGATMCFAIIERFEKQAGGNNWFATGTLIPITSVMLQASVPFVSVGAGRLRPLMPPNM